MFDFSVYGASESASAMLQSVDTPYNAPIAFVANTIIFIVINYSTLFGGTRRKTRASVERDEEEEWGSRDLALRGINVPSRSRLPASLKGWQALVVSFPQDSFKADSSNPWSLLKDFFAKKDGLQLLLPRQRTMSIRSKKQVPASGSASSSTTINANTLSISSQEEHYNSPTQGLTCYARNTQGKAVVVRVVRCNSEGKEHLQILQYLREKTHRHHENHSQQNPKSRHFDHLSTSSEEHFLEHAHVLPLFLELIFHDLVFGVFPRVDITLEHVLGIRIAESSLSVGDALDVIIQALEATVYIHKERIAHQSLFLSSFLIEWQPTAQSLHCTSRTNPRVYLTDFDNAVIFPGDMRAQDMRIPKHSKPTHYNAQQVAPELRDDDTESEDGMDDAEGKQDESTYCPFTLDVWHFGHDLEGFDCGIPKVSAIFMAMSCAATSRRIFAIEALERLQKIVASQNRDLLGQPLLPSQLGD